MAFCSQCGADISDDATSCDQCGAVFGSSEVVDNVWDRTDEFDAEDISDNKVYALCAYLLGFLGIIMCLIIGKDSPYAKFHAREALKLRVAILVVYVISAILCWTCIVPIVGVVFILIFGVLNIISFIQVCLGKAKEPWLIRSIGALH